MMVLVLKLGLMTLTLTLTLTPLPTCVGISIHLLVPAIFLEFAEFANRGSGIKVEISLNSRFQKFLHMKLPNTN